jgi:hypothetical protein
MAISTFQSEGSFPTYDPHHRDREAMVEVFRAQCHACGFEPADPLSPPAVCPKCHGSSWERFVLPGSILGVSDSLR